MLGRRIYTYLVYWLSVSALTLCNARAGVDPVQFFTQGSPEVTKKLGTKRGISRYQARDRFGNALQVRTGESPLLFAEIGGSLLSQGIGLPSLPAYPTFVQLEPGSHWIRATVQMQSSGSLSVTSMSKLTPAQMGEWLGQMTINQILGNQTVLNSPELISMAGQHVITPSHSQAFQGYAIPSAKPSEDTLARYFDLIPRAKLGALSSKDAAEALNQLNAYLSRIEKMSAKDIDKLFGAYFDATPYSAEYRTEIKRRIQNARADAIRYFKTNFPAFSAETRLGAPENVDRPVFHFPAYKATRGTSPDQVIGSPEFKLWAHYFHEPSQLVSTPSNTISKLLTEARERHDIYYVGPTLDPDFFETETSDPPQTHLNPSNAKTLVVVPANDQEAIEIARVAKASGARVMKLEGDEFKHGVRLTDALADRIIHTAKSLKVDKVVVVEMPGVTPQVEKKISDRGFEFVPVDHHSDNFAARAQPFSSLEQAAQLLGYDLGGKSKTIEVSDRSFVLGLADLGLSKKAVSQLYPQKVKDEVLREFTKFKSSRMGDFYVIKDYEGNFPELIGSIVLHEWPRKANVLILGPGPMLRFSGNPKFRSMLTRTFDPFESQVRSHLFGGDAMRSQYWALRGIPRDSVGSFMGKALKEVEGVLDQADAKSFRDVVAKRLNIPKSIFSASEDSRAPGSIRSSCYVQQISGKLLKK